MPAGGAHRFFFSMRARSIGANDPYRIVLAKNALPSMVGVFQPGMTGPLEIVKCPMAIDGRRKSARRAIDADPRSD
jgi:hypothetical protein